MTNREVSALFKQVLPSGSGFRIKGSLAFVSPVHRVLKGFCCEGSSFDKASFYVNVFLMPLSIPMTHLYFNLGKRIRDATDADRWSVTQPNMVADLTRTFSSEMKSLLTCDDTVIDVAEVAAKLQVEDDPYVQEGIAYLAAQEGHVKEAIDRLERLTKALDRQVSWQSAMADRVGRIKLLLLANPIDAQEQLRQWQGETVCNLHLTDLLAERAG